MEYLDVYKQCEEDYPCLDVTRVHVRALIAYVQLLEGRIKGLEAGGEVDDQA